MNRSGHSRKIQHVSAFLSRAADSISDPILRRALKEPVAFWGGFTAGALALNLKEDPLRSWIERTAADAKAESAGQEVVSIPGAVQQSSTQEQLPQAYRITPSNGSGRL
ncbi:g4767 [Coccomyxa viridis]|uniref:G4767 protein n=1 Tax=Coccomyxa viridis TaxID=1274662 RepID=A0ABP1FR44_9CHLO